MHTVLQLTDLHLFKCAELLCHGVSTNKNFQEVIARQFHHHDAYPDVIFLTGDLSQDEHADAYRIIVETLDHFNIPICWIPGNHDCVATMTPVFEASKNLRRGDVLDLGNWRFVFLNTQLIGSVAGKLSDKELLRLEGVLTQASSQQKNIALVMHHPPVAVDSGLMDSSMLTNADNLFELLLPYNNVKLILTGHVHQDYSLSYQNIAIETAPATCLQFSKKANDIDIKRQMGCKTFEFTDAGYQAKSVTWAF